MAADPPSSPLALAARRHADDVIKPQVREWESAAVFPREAAALAAADGLLGLFAPVTVGGQGAGLAAAMDVFEELGREVPVIVSGTITDASGRTLSGQTTEAFWNSVRHADLFTIGLNCALGAAQLRP